MSDYQESPQQQIELLKQKLKEKETELTKYRMLVDKYALPEEEMDEFSDEEIICVAQLAKLRQFAESGATFDKAMAETFKIFNAQLASIRSEVRKRKPIPTKLRSAEELMKLASID